MASFDENGKYIKTNWKAGDKITATKLNKIEESIEAINDNDISRHVEADTRLDALEAKDVAHDKEFTNVKNTIADNKAAAELGDYEINSRMTFLENELNEGIEEVHNVAETVDGKIATAEANMTAQVNQGKVDMEAMVAEVEADLEGLHAKDEELSEQLAYKASKIEVDVERKRIDNFLALEDGSTTGDAELIDIRTGSNGIKYGNAGSSVREQIKNLENGGINDKSIKPIKTSFIKNNALYYKSKHIWQTSAISSYGTSDIIVENLSYKQDLYIKIGSSDCVDKAACVAIVRAYSNDYQNGTVECGIATLNSSHLGKNIKIPHNSWTINKVKISLYSSFATVIESDTITTVTDIILMENNEEIKYTLNNIKVKKSDIEEDEYEVITVKADGSGDYTNPVVATNRVFSDTLNGLKKVIIEIYEGEYDIYNAWEEENKTGWYITGANVGWNTNSNISIVGVGDRDKIICKCYLPNSQDATTVEKASCINMNFGGILENITFISKNTRYCCHSDNSNYYKNLKYEIKNCVFKHLGNEDNFWAWHGAWMEGSSSGNEYLFEECDFYGVRGAYGTHTNKNFEIPVKHRFKNCKFFNENENNPTINFESLGSGVKNKVYLEGCYINNSIGINENSDGDGIDIELMGHGNSRVTINNPKNAKTYFTDM